MALGSHTKAELLDMLRTKVQDYTSKKLGDYELTEILNMKTWEVFLLMTRDMKKFWFGATEDLVALVQDTNSKYWRKTAPTDMWDVIGIKWIYTSGGDTFRSDIKRVDLESLEDYMSNTFKADDHAYCVIGQQVYTTFDSDLNDGVTQLPLFYIRTPAELASSGPAFDLPDQFTSLVLVLSAIDIIASLNINSEAKQVAMQMLAMQEKAAREAAGLPLQSEEEDRELLSASGIPSGSEPTGGSKGDRPVQ